MKVALALDLPLDLTLTLMAQVPSLPSSALAELSRSPVKPTGPSVYR